MALWLSAGLSLINIPRAGRIGSGIAIISSNKLIVKKLRSGKKKSFDNGLFLLLGSVEKNYLLPLFIEHLIPGHIELQPQHSFLNF